MNAYHWPGNVRELENTIRKFLVFRNPSALAQELSAKAARKPMMTAPAADAGAGEVPPANTPILEHVTKQVETDTILAALNSTRWNRKQAAALLRIDYKALLYKMKKLGVEDAPVPGLAQANHAPKTAVAGG